MTVRTGFRRLPPYPFAGAGQGEESVFAFPPCQRLMLYDDADGEVRIVTVANQEVLASAASAFVRATRHVGSGAAVLSGLDEDVVVTVYDASLGVEWTWTDEITQPHAHGDIGVDADGAVYFAIATTDTVTVYKVADGTLEWSQALDVEGVDTTVGPPVSIVEDVVLVAGGDRVFALAGDTGTEIDSLTWSGATACAGSCFGNAFVVFARAAGATYAQRFTYTVPGFGPGELAAEGAVLVHDGVEQPWFSDLQGSALMYGGSTADGYVLARVDPATLEVLWRNADSEVGVEAITSVTPTVYTGIGFERRMFAGRNVASGEAPLLRGFARVSGASLAESGPDRTPPASHAIRVLECTDCVEILGAEVEYHLGSFGPVTVTVDVPVTVAAGDMIVFAFASLGEVTSIRSEFVNLNDVPDSLAPLGTSFVTSLWGFAAIVDTPFSTFDVEGVSLRGYSQVTVLRGSNLRVVRTDAFGFVSVDANTPVELAGATQTSALQIFMGAYESVDI